MTTTTVSTKQFIKELEWCARFIERKTTIPILSNVLLSLRPNGLLYMTGTDLEVGGLTSIDTLTTGDPFELTAPVHGLLKYLKKVDESTLTLVPKLTYRQPHPLKKGEEGPLELEVLSDVGLTIQHGVGQQVHVNGMTVDSFPVLPARPLKTIEIWGFETAIPQVATSISAETSRFTLNGALLTVEDKQARLVSTDGHRLSLVDLQVDESAQFKALISKTALLELARLGDSAFVCRDENHVWFASGHRVIIARVLTGTFPDWERVLPKDRKYTVTVANLPLKKLVDRVAVFTDERSRAVALTVNGSLSITSERHEHSATGDIPFDGPVFAYPYTTGFKADYLLDFLGKADPSVTLSFSKASEAAIWASKGWQYVLMPMRIGVDGCDPCVAGEFEELPWARAVAAVGIPTFAPKEAPEPAVVADAVPIPEVPSYGSWADAAIANGERQIGDEAGGSTTAAVSIPAVPCVPAASTAPDDAVTSSDTVDAVTLARLLGIGQSTIYVRVKKGTFPAAIPGSRPLSWARSAIEALAAA